MSTPQDGTDDDVTPRTEREIRIARAAYINGAMIWGDPVRILRVGPVVGPDCRGCV